MLSRRNFIRNVAIGAAGAALPLGRVPRSMAAGKEVGIITLDAIFLVYIPAIPTSVEGETHSSFAFGKNFSLTLSLSLPQNPDIALAAVVPPGQEGLGESAVSQFQSMAVPGAIVLRTIFNRRIGGAVESLSIGAGSDTGFYGLLRPKLRLAGRPGRLRYRIAEASGVIVAGRSGLQTQDGFSQQTADSLRALYVTDRAQLVPPRFVHSLILSSGVGTELNRAADGDSGVNATASAIATVIDQTGFQSESLIQAFAPGSPVQITYSSVQEFPSRSIATFTLAPNDTNQPIRIYQDLAMKTWVVVPLISD
jgi:hypothetical protein